MLKVADPSGDPDFKPDFNKWATQDRTELQDTKMVSATAAEKAAGNYDAVVVGPWMDLWDIEADARATPKPNPHVAQYLSSNPERNHHNPYLIMIT